MKSVSFSSSLSIFVYIFSPIFEVRAVQLFPFPVDREYLLFHVEINLGSFDKLVVGVRAQV